MTYRRVTVFGGSGFLGRYVVKRLVADGTIVRVAVRDPEAASFLKPAGQLGQVVPTLANIRDDTSVAAAVQGVDAVVNLVGILAEGGPQRFGAVHTRGAQRVAAAAAAAGVPRLVHVSALGADARSDSLYARSKAAGEAAVAEAFAGATIMRPSLVFGPEDSFFNRFAAMARFTPFLPLIGGGHTRFQPVFVGDVAEAIRAALYRPATAGQTFELGGPRVYTFKALMETMLATIGRSRVLIPVPFWAASFQAGFLELLPVPPLTKDQVRLLRHDTVATGSLPGLAELGIAPTSVEAELPGYMDRFRPGGRFAPRPETRGRAAGS